MSQLTIRAPDEVVARVRAAAAARGSSMNEYVVLVLDAATDASLASDPAERVRERLAAAGLLTDAAARRGQPPSAADVAAARRRAGRGTPLDQLVSSER